MVSSPESSADDQACGANRLTNGSVNALAQLRAAQQTIHAD
jgi:hypothetical protein